MKEENEEPNNDLVRSDNEEIQKIHETLDELGELAKNDDADLSAIKGKIQELKDGTQVLSGEFEDDEVEDEELTLKQKKALYRYVYRLKTVDDETVEAIDDEEIERLTRISQVMFQRLTYYPKKKFNVEYKKNRQRKNRLTKKSRIENR